MHSWEKNIIRPTFGSFQDQSIQLHFTVAVPSNTPTGNQSHPITEAVPSNTPTGSQSHPFTAVVPSNTPTGSQSHPVTAAIPSHPQATHFHSTQSDLSVHQADIQECENL